METAGSEKKLLNTGALLRAGGIGLAVGFILEVINAGLAVAMTATSAGSGANGLSSGGASSALAGLGGLAICCCCLIVLAYVGIGVGYSWFAEKDGNLPEPAPAALGGAIATFVDAILMGLCSVGVNYLVGILNLAAQSSDSPLFGAGLGATVGLGGTAFGLLLNVCIYPFVFAAFGAAGAAIYAAIASSRSKTQPAVG